MKRGAKGAKAVKKNVTRRPRADKPRKRIVAKSQHLAKDLSEAREQQAATSEILRVISRSRSDAQPVFDTMVRAALRLCGASSANVVTFDGELIHVAAIAPVRAKRAAALHHHFAGYPRPPSRDTANTRAVLTRRVVMIPDVLKDRDYAVKATAAAAGYRSVLSVPLMRDKDPIGAITVARTQPGRFPERQIALLKTFADQAVIAIENVRLFEELEARNRDLTEALEQQTATSEVLKVISRSAFDLQPVLETVIENAVRLCGAEHGHVHRFDGELLRLAAGYSANAEMLDYLREHPNRLGPGTISGMAGIERKPIHCHDVLKVEGYQRGEAQKLAGFRTILAVPMLSADALLGVLMIWKTRVEPFTDKQIELVSTFADQAAIAIENVRLFKELEARNRDLTEALEHQTATGEVLKVIGRSTFDLQPVFTTLVENAVRLCAAERGLILRYDGRSLRYVASHNVSPELKEFFERTPPAVDRSSASGRAILERRTVHHPDVLNDPEYNYGGTRADPYRTVLAVPMLKGDEILGVIVLAHADVKPFTDKQIVLIETFADQAVIAIENVRLFKELEARNRDLTEALEQQTATSEILRVISRSPTDVQPVFETIVAAAMKLCRAHSASVFTYDDELVRLAALANATAQGADAIRAIYPRPAGRDNAASRAILDRSVVAIPDILEDPEYAPKAAALTGGFRSALSVPLLREGSPIGAITVGRPEAGPFPEKQIALLQTFADQAVIAIENVRLFTELEARNRDLMEALEQQTATSEILRVISSSPTDVQPVFDTIANAALELCRASAANVFTYDGELVHVAAMKILDPAYVEVMRKVYPRPLSRDTAVLRAIQTSSLVMIPDVLEDRDYMAALGIHSAAGGFRSVLAVPLIRDGQAIGGIAVGRSEPGPFPDGQVALLKTFADQAVIAIENVRLFNETKEALEHQKASAEVLGVISSSVADTKPVFDKILESCERLFEGHHVGMSLLGEDDLVHLGGYRGPGGEAFAKTFPYRPGPDSATATSILERRLIHFANVQTDDGVPERMRTAGWLTSTKSQILAPMISKDRAIGAIFVGRPVVRRFTEKEIALLRTFADQAVIAIENVRLFTELDARNRDLTEALEHQTATSEILRVISSSPTDVQPVFEVIGERAAKLCDAQVSLVSRVDGELIHLVALHGMSEEAKEISRRYFPMPLSAESATSRAVRNCAVVHLADVLADAQYGPKDAAKSGGWRSCLAVPMLREGQVTGAIFVGRANSGRFPDSKVELLKTFADQAVIAIENVRLFTEVESRNRELTESLEHQTATSEILRVISSSPTDVQPVFDIICERARKLCDAQSSVVERVEGDQIHLAAVDGVTAEGKEAVRRYFPSPITAGALGARAIRTRSIVHVSDVLTDPEYDAKEQARAGGWRNALAVPMLREGQVIGAIFVGRTAPGRFPDSKVELLKTFADQAVIAVENVRLFNELKTRTAQLTHSVGELKALGEVGQAVSSTLDLETVLDTIVSRATELAGMDAGSIWEYDEAREEFHLRATDRLPEELVEALRATPIKKGEGALGRLALTGEPVEIPDIVDERSYQSRVRNALIRRGIRSVLAVPLLREDHLLGALAVNRKTAGAFDPQVTELLKTFATQSALAIQNARLFREIEVKSRELQVASQHKSEFLANMSHELRTPLNAILGFSEVLSERMFGEINEKQAEYLADILESGRHLLSLINDILDLSKIEAGRMELEPSEFDLPGAIENTLILVRERAQRRGITLGRTVDERLGTIRADERKVKQVLLNLLSNALKFTPEGGRIDVRAGLQDGHAQISVADTGVGIAPEDQKTVFEEFRQVGSAAKKVEGTGLGLAISRKFVELHGGTIGVESKVGSGSTFTFTLPLQ